MKKAFTALNLKPRFHLLAPIDIPQSAYALFAEFDVQLTSNMQVLSDILDGALCENFHYDLCRRLGQLGPVRVFIIQSKRQSAETAYLNEMQRRGIQLGNTKPAPLDRRTGWERVFEGRFVRPD